MNAQGGQLGESSRRLAMREGFGVRRLPVGPAEVRRLPAEPVDADAALRSAVDRARRLSAHQEEPYRSLAFSALLQHFLGGNGGPVDVGGRPSQELAGPPATDIPIAEFLALRRLDSHPDRVVAVAYYHFHRFDGQGVSTKDLVDAYTRSRAKRPQNYPDVIASCTRKGYLVDGGRRDGMKTWIITRTGETHVEQDL